MMWYLFDGKIMPREQPSPCGIYSHRHDRDVLSRSYALIAGWKVSNLYTSSNSLWDYPFDKMVLDREFSNGLSCYLTKRLDNSEPYLVVVNRRFLKPATFKHVAFSNYIRKLTKAA